TYYARVKANAYAILSLVGYVQVGSTVTAATPQFTYQWTGVTNTTWTVSTNWSPSGPPGRNDIVIIDTNSVNQPVLDATTTVYAIYLSTTGLYNSTFTINNPLTVTSTFTVGAMGLVTHSTNSNVEVIKSSITASYMVLIGTMDVTAKGY